MSTPPQPIVSPPGSGATFSAVGDVYRVLATGEQTGGVYALVEARVYPGGGPPLHWHTREDETFFVLEGEITFTVDAQVIVAKAGTFLHAPRLSKHRFANLGAKPARMLIQTLPAGFEKFMAEFARPVASIDAPPLPVSPDEIQRLLETAPRFGIHICPPPHP